MIISGTVLDVQHKSGQNDGGAYSYLNVFLLDGIAVQRCKIADSFGDDVPSKGEELTAVCRVTPYKDNSGTPQLSVSLIARVPVGARAAA